MSTARRVLGLVALACAASCDQLNCYDDTDMPPFPPQPMPNRAALPLDTPAATDDGEFEILLHADPRADWPPSAGPVALSIEVRGADRAAELVAAPPFFADDEARLGSEAEVAADGPALFRISSAVPDPGLWCLPVDVTSGDRDDGLDVCFEAG